MILDMRRCNYDRDDAREATIIVNARLNKFLRSDLECNNAKIISFSSFADKDVCSEDKIKKFLARREYFCPQLEVIDLSRACSPDADLESDEAKRFYQFVKALKEDTNIEIVATPELEKLFPILLQKKEEKDKSLEDKVIPLQEEEYSLLQSITKLQLAQAAQSITPELCHEILEHNNNNVVTESVISAIDAELSKGGGQLDKYIPTLFGCFAGRYISSDNFDALIDLAEKYIKKDHVTAEDINFCFGLQKESSQSEESYQRINNLIKELIPHLPEEVRQDLDAKAALKEKEQQEYIQKRQRLQARVNEYSGYLLLSDGVYHYEDVDSEHIHKIADTIYENLEKYVIFYEKILDKIDDEGDEYKIKAASHWIEPIIFKINSLGLNEERCDLLENLTEVVTKNQDVRLEYGHVFCQQLKKDNTEFWLERIKALLDENSDDHILLMNTYEDMEQAYKLHPELISKSFDIFKDTLEFDEIDKGFNDHLHTLASIVGDTAHDHPECADEAIKILGTLDNIEKNLHDSSAKGYLRSKIDEAFDKIKQSDINSDLKRSLIFIHEKDQKIFVDTVKELMNDPETDQQSIEKAIAMRLNAGLDVMIDDYDTAECLKWNLAVLKSKALQNKGPKEISACAEQIFKNAVIQQLEDNPNYDPSETLQAIYDVAPFWLKKLREGNSESEDLFILQHFDRFPEKVQKLYVGECTDKMGNLIETGAFDKFPEVAVQKLRLEVIDFLSDISAKSTYKQERSLSEVEKWAKVLKEIDGYSSPEVCVVAFNEAMNMRSTIALPSEYNTDERACAHFAITKEDIKPFVKISTDIIDNVFEQICLHKGDPSFTNLFRKTKFHGFEGDAYLQELMGEEAAEAFLSGDENYKKLWDKKMVEKSVSAYLMYEKPHEILQDTPLAERGTLLMNIEKNTYLIAYMQNWDWKEFPEVVDPGLLESFVRHSDKDDEDVVKAVKTACKTRLGDTPSECSESLLKALMLTYDAEAQKGIEDEEIFAILYSVRFSKKWESVRKNMEEICSNFRLTAPKLKSLCETSDLFNRNRWKLKPNTNEK